VVIGTKPVCYPIECAPIDVLNAGEALTSNPLIHNERIRIVCDAGYSQTGDTELLCDTSSGEGK